MTLIAGIFRTVMKQVILWRMRLIQVNLIMLLSANMESYQKKILPSFCGNMLIEKYCAGICCGNNVRKRILEYYVKIEKFLRGTESILNIFCL